MYPHSVLLHNPPHLPSQAPSLPSTGQPALDLTKDRLEPHICLALRVESLKRRKGAMGWFNPPTHPPFFKRVKHRGQIYNVQGQMATLYKFFHCHGSYSTVNNMFQLYFYS